MLPHEKGVGRKMKLQNQVALITGGSSGIGKATAERFASEGATVAVVASSSLPKAEKVVASIHAACGATAKAFVADIRDPSAVDALVKTVYESCGPIDILVNSAGVYVRNEIGKTTEEEYRYTMDINLKGTFFMINAVTPLMKKRRTGKIINVASIAAYRGAPHYSLYCASKAAIVMLTRNPCQRHRAGEHGDPSERSPTERSALCGTDGGQKCCNPERQGLLPT